MPTPRTARAWRALGLACLAGLFLAGHAAAQSSPYATSRAQPVVSDGMPAPAVYTPPPPPVRTAFADPMPAVPSSPPAPADFASVRQVRFQEMGAPPVAAPVAPPGSTGDAKTYQIQVIPPGKMRVSRVENDEKLQERIRQETKEYDPYGQITFPPEPILSRETYKGRGNLWEPHLTTVEPYFVAYEKLLFEEKNSERYGWDVGVMSPVVLGLNFYLDVAMLPYNIAKGPCRKYEYSSGYCLPGDPVPLLLYPPELSLTGSAAEIAVIIALVAIFP